MEKMTNRELRRKKIERLLPQLENQPNFSNAWVIMIPSVRQGFEVYNFCNAEDFQKMYDHSKKHYEELVKTKGETFVKEMMSYLIINSANPDFFLKMEPRGKASYLLWMMVAHFTKDDSAGEIFEDERVVMVDVNLVELPKKPTLH